MQRKEWRIERPQTGERYMGTSYALNGHPEGLDYAEDEYIIYANAFTDRWQELNFTYLVDEKIIASLTLQYWFAHADGKSAPYLRMMIQLDPLSLLNNKLETKGIPFNVTNTDRHWFRTSPTWLGEETEINEKQFFEILSLINGIYEFTKDMKENIGNALPNYKEIFEQTIMKSPDPLVDLCVNYVKQHAVLFSLSNLPQELNEKISDAGLRPMETPKLSS